jgi:methyltransferase (TIGR00027 family)
VEGERRLSRDVAGMFAVPFGRATRLVERTRVVDAVVARAIGRGIVQIVLLGAGYDGRALRFGGGPVRWFEVDLPALQSDKRRRLGALGIEPTGIAYVGVDLVTGDLGAALAAAGHDPDRPTLFVCEGLLASLTLEATVSLCETLRARAAPESALVVDFSVAPEVRPSVRALRAAADLMLALAGEPRRHEFRPDDPQKLMAVTGWRVAARASSADSRIDGSHTLVLTCEPAPTRRA